MHVAIICGYGLWDVSLRSPRELAGLYDYYQECFCHLQGENIIEVVLCGGYTNPLKPCLSEAQSVYNAIQDKKLNTTMLDLLLEEESSNAVQNIAFALKVLRRSRPTEVTIYCDTVRRWKMKVIAARVLGNMRHSVVAFPRMDIHPNSKAWKQNVQALRLAFSRRLFETQLHAPYASKPKNPPSP
ncbi:MAG: hypothetical protein AAB515_01600 [Patescibacteria group bacterium]